MKTTRRPAATKRIPRRDLFAELKRILVQKRRHFRHKKFNELPGMGAQQFFE